MENEWGCEADACGFSLADFRTWRYVGPMPETTSHQRVEAALEALRAGKMIVLADDEDRENEGDLCLAAEHCSPQAINFMARYGRGLICLSLQAEQIERLELPMMVSENRANRSTAFTISIEAREGVTTGISAKDRSHTIQTAIAPNVRAEDIVSPGHVFPLRSQPGGVLQRAGHTEGSADLSALAGLHPSSVICEIMNEDGTMARREHLAAFAKKHELPLLTIADIIAYRMSKESLVSCRNRWEVESGSGASWTVSEYTNDIDDRIYLVMRHGTIGAKPQLLRVHRPSFLRDATILAFANKCRESSGRLSDAMRRMEEEGAGTVMLVQPAVSLIRELEHLSSAGESQATGASAGHASALREFGLGAQVLRAEGLAKIRLLTRAPRRLPGLGAYGIEVVEQVAF